MKKLVCTVLVAVSAMSMVVTEVQAKRMGSGTSAGRQSSMVGKQPVTPAQNQAMPSAAKPAPAASAAPTAAAKPASPWKGILGGALLGLGLGALLSHLGIGGALASMISTILMVGLLAAAAFFIYRMLASKRQGNGMAKTGLQPAYGGASATPEIGSRLQPAAQPSTSMSHAAVANTDGAAEQTWQIPADFDTAAFLRNAKTYFIRLQAAWDRADAADLRDFTTPELFAEMKQQLLERGASPNHTDVLSLEAQLLGVETTQTDYLASVQFTGMIKEGEGTPAESFVEVWNLSKPTSGQGGWLLAGIQQVS